MSSINVILDSHEVRFLGDKVTAGIYRLDDPFKPYLHPMCTPKGHLVTNCSPGDHRHHKGLMYGLCCKDLVFWEENPGAGDCGVQEIVSTTPIEGGIRQELLWRAEKGDLHTYKETREITCMQEEDAFLWTWKTHRVALRSHRLVKSHWSMDLPDGRKVNYHGLGIRLPWMWCWGGPGQEMIELNGERVKAPDAAGTRARSVGFVGQIDGQWEHTDAAVNITQSQEYGWYVLRDGFPYLAVGPSNLEEVDVARGQVFDETYEIRVEDR